MQIFDKYFFFGFLRYFLGALILLTGVALIAQVMETLNLALAYGGPNVDIFFFYLYFIPNFISIVSAPALMFAVSFVVAMYSRSNEIAVVMAAGRSFQRILMPITIFTFIFAFSLLVFNEYLTFPGLTKAYNMKHKLRGATTHRLENQRSLRNAFEAKAGNTFFYMGFFNPNNGEIRDLQILELYDSGKNKRLIESLLVNIPEDGPWKFHDGFVIDFNDDGSVEKKEFFEDKEIYFEQRRDYFSIQIKGFDETNVFELLDLINLKESRGESANTDYVEFYWHFSFPFVCFFVVIIGGVIGSQLKKGAMASSIGLSTVFTIVYYIVMFLGKSFGNNGTLPPFIAGWLANILFVIVSAFMLWKFHK